MLFTNKVVLITGGSRGIGAAISLAFAERGARVAINYQSNDTRAEAFLKDLPGSGHALFKADIGDIAACNELVESIVYHYGRIDILINNAGIHEKHPIETTDYANWIRIFQETININLMAPARLMYLVSDHMRRQGGGRIVNISSRGAFRGEPDQPAYGASKAGLNSLSQSLAQKLAPFGISVGVVAPGFVETEMVADILNSPTGEAIRAQSPFNRVAKPEEVAHSVLFLASDAATWNSGSIIDVNGASYLRT
ncbi:MAG: SDR family oxidoreductase [Saprospiraceae bacterium]|nr:SDR family oxidoreductase [Saprospiraceae bacterium]